MKRPIFTLLIFAITLTALAQATQPCIVKQYNQKQQKTPLAGVQVEVRDAQSATSAANGAVTLQFATLKPGDRVNVRRIIKPGYEIFNKAVIDQWTITRGATTEIVLVQSSYFTQLKSKLTQSSTDNYKKKYEQAKAELAQLQKAGKLKEEEYRQQLNDLEDQYDNALKNLDNYIDQFARIDLSEVSEEEQRILDMVEEGKIDEAVKAYEALDISGKLRQARQNVKAIDEGIEKLEDKRNQELQAIADLKERQKREIATLKLAGGKENYDKVARMLKENALADTTDIDAVREYAAFAYAQKDFKEAERFYLICLNGTKDNLYRQAAFQNILGVLYANLHDYAKAEEYYLKALENYTQLFTQNPDAYRADLAMTQNDLGILYYDLHDYAKAEEYLLKALENRTPLFIQNPDAYRSSLADTQNNLGNLYYYLHDYGKAEEYHLKALENRTQLFIQDPDAYRADLAMTQHNLGSLYDDLHDYAKAEEYYLKALENRTQLFTQNPDAYRADLASTQNNLGALYSNLHDYAKAEEYYLKALENKTQLFTQNPEAYRADLAMTQNNLGALYSDLHDYAKSEEYYLKALENKTLLFTQNPDAYRAGLAMTQHNLGNLYKNLDDYAKSEEYYLKALENKTQLFSQNPDVYRVDLATTQRNLMVLYSIMENWEKYDDMWEKALKSYEELCRKDSSYQEDLEYLQLKATVISYEYREKANENAKAGNYAQAIEYIDRLLTLEPKNLSYYASKIEFLLKKGDEQEAEKTWRKAKEFDMDISQMEISDTTTLESLDRLLSRNPEEYRADLVFIQSRLGDMYYESKDYDRSEGYYLEALENCKMLFDKQPESYQAKLAWIQYSLMYIYVKDNTKLEQYDAMLNAALANYEVLCQNNVGYGSKIVDLRNRKGWRLLRTGKTDEAIRLFESTYQLDPKRSATYLASGCNAKAYEYAKANDFTKALETIDRAIFLRPEEANYYDSKGEILLMKGDEQEAVKMWRKVLELDPDFLKKYEGGTDFYKQLKEKGLLDN